MGVFVSHTALRQNSRKMSVVKPPPIDTPFTRMTEHWYTYQGNPKCREMEMVFYKCAASAGGNNLQKCAQEYDDLNECLFSRKQKMRYQLMQQARRKQNLPYEEAPPMDSI